MYGYMSLKAFRKLEQSLGAGPAHVYSYARALGAGAARALRIAKEERDRADKRNTKQSVRLYARAVNMINNHIGVTP